MAELKPVSDTHALLESMLQKLRLNPQTNSNSVTDMQTCSPSGKCNAVEDSSKRTVYQFGFSSNNKEPDGPTSAWNKWENPWTQQSSHFEDALTHVAKQPVRRISKNNSGFSGKPKRPPLIWGEQKNFTSGDVTSWVGDDQMPEPEKKQQFSLDRGTSSNVSSLYKTEAFQNPPDLLAPTLTTTSTALEKPEVRGQSGTWSWGTGIERNDSSRFHEQSGKTTKTSRRKWGEAKRWAQSVKERWREKHRSALTRQREDGERQAQREVQSNHSSMPIDVKETPTALTETTDIHREEISSTAPDEDGPGSLSYMSDSLFSSGTTSDLMEEIFSGTEWAQFLSVNSTKMHQSIELADTNNQSQEEELHSKWTHEDTTDLHLDLTQPSFAQDMASGKQTETSQMSVTDLPTSPLQTDPFKNQSQNTNLNPNESHNSEQSRYSQLDPNETKVTEDSDPRPMSSQVSDPSHIQLRDGTEGFIPLLDLSYAKLTKRSSVTSHGSLSRKREHWTKRRESFEIHTTQEMEHEENGGSITASPASSLDSLNSVSQDSESSETSGTAVKKRRMEDTRRVRFAEEVIILPPTYLPDSDVDENEEENEDNDWQEEPSPRHSFPKWIVSLKHKSGKYKF